MSFSQEIILAESVTCSIVIPTRLRHQLLSQTLDSLARQTESGFEVIVVCDGEDPDTRALSQCYTAEFPLSWIFTPESHRQPSARNTGARAAKGEILLFLDDDTPAVPDWVSQHRKHHQTNRDGALAVVGRVIDVFVREPKSHTERLLREQRKSQLAKLEASLTRPGVESIGGDADFWRCFGVNCSMSRQTFLDCGGFDPVLILSEDMELGHRLYDRGMSFLFEPNALLYHHDTRDLREYLSHCWNEGGRADVYRVLKKRQRNAQTLGLTSLVRRGPLARLQARAAWNHPGTVRRIAELSRAVTESTGSKLSFGLWRRLSFSVQYWEAVKSEGLTADALRQLVGSALPVLMFHSISPPREKREKQFNLSPNRFSRIMQWLKRHGYNCVSPSEGLLAPSPNRSLVVTFDDGFEDFYFEVFPQLDLFGLKPIVFPVVDQIGKWSVWDHQFGYRSRKLLSLEQIREMSRHGVEFGSHTLTHPWLPDLSENELRREIAESKSRLEDLLGSEVTCFAYPYGGVDSRVRAAAARAGYRFGFSTRPGLNFWDDLLALRRIRVSDSGTTLGLLLGLKTGRSLDENIRAALLYAPRVVLKFLPDSLSRSLKRGIRAARRESDNG